MSAILPLCGSSRADFSVNEVTNRPDGGVDGLINTSHLNDPLALLAPKSVLQFKSGPVSLSKARRELLEEPVEDHERIITFLRRGFKLVWFVGQDLSDIELAKFESGLSEIVESIYPDAPRPSVVDANRLRDYLALAPVLAYEISGGGDEPFLSVDKALGLPAHRRLKFVRSKGFPQLVEEIWNLVDNGNSSIKYLKGEPGIGKTRTVLEAIREAGLSDSVCYFPTQLGLRSFLTIAHQNELRFVAVVDEYVPDSGEDRIYPQDVPEGVRVIAIGHGYRTNREEQRYMLPIAPLSDEEIAYVLEASYPILQSSVRAQAVSLSRRNIRLAGYLCENLKSGTNFIDENTIESVVEHELNRLEQGRDVLAFLSLVPLLPRNRESEFCSLVGMNLTSFQEACRTISQTCGFIQQNATVAYVAIPAIAHVALLRLWRTRKVDLEPIFRNPGSFGDQILERLNRLPEGEAKEEMLAYFRPAVFPKNLADFQNPAAGRKILTLLTADPDSYLPWLHSLFRGDRGAISSFPYEHSGVGRRDVIWKLRDLAQFSDFFPACEEIVYWMAREEAPTIYSSSASSYWICWFRPYFDNTTYALEDRYNLIARRLADGDKRDRELISEALVHSFPEVGLEIPQEVVGGRLAPPETKSIHFDNLDLAGRQVPRLFLMLLEQCESLEERSKIAFKFVDNYFEWLRVLNDPDPIAKIVASDHFPLDARRSLAVNVRKYISIARERTEAEWLNSHGELHERLYKLISDESFEEDLAFLLRTASFELERSQDLTEVEHSVVQELSTNSDYKETVITLLSDAESFGASRLGQKVARRVARSALAKKIEHLSSMLGLSNGFVLGFIRGALEVSPDSRSKITNLIKTHLKDHAIDVLTALSSIDFTQYVQTAADLLDTGVIEPNILRNRWFFDSSSQAEMLRPIVEALERRIKRDDVEAANVIIGIASDLVSSKVTLEQFDAVALLAFRIVPVKNSWDQTHDWMEVGRWLLNICPTAVLDSIADLPLTSHTHSSRILSDAAKSFPNETIEALTKRFLAREPDSYLFASSINDAVAQLPLGNFREWMTTINDEAAIILAGQLPKPFLNDEGRAVVPAHTRIFFERFPPSSKPFENILDYFNSNTFSTGVFTGHGVSLFEKRVTIAEQLSHDSNTGIRTWAEQFLSSSRQLLTRARSNLEMEAALKDTDSW